MINYTGNELIHLEFIESLKSSQVSLIFVVFGVFDSKILKDTLTDPLMLRLEIFSIMDVTNN